MNLPSAATVLVLASGVDFGLGDPWHWPHPVQGMGWVIARYAQWVLKVFHKPWILRCLGVGLALGLVGGVGLLGWFGVVGAWHIHSGVGVGVECVLLASCLAGRSLRDAAQDVLTPLTQEDLVTARSHLSRYVGRDTEALSKCEILRAVLETVTENGVDGVMAPVFYAIVGAFLLPFGSVPLALAYKAASTLDSMVGYREAPYRDLGWCSARLEDGLTWFPCRLTVLTLGLLSGQPVRVWRVCQRDAIADPSPNSGWSECVYAAILGVQVGGTNWYGGKAKSKPLLGDRHRPITPEVIDQALDLTRSCYLLWVGLSVGLLWVKHWGFK